MIEALTQLAARLEKEGLAYGRQSGIKPGDTPAMSSPEARGMACTAAAYAYCAKQIRDLIKAHGKGCAKSAALAVIGCLAFLSSCTLSRLVDRGLTGSPPARAVETIARHE